MKSSGPENDLRATDFERQLLESWASEGPSEEARLRVLGLATTSVALLAAESAMPDAGGAAPAGIKAATGMAGGAKIATGSLAPKALGVFGIGKWAAVVLVGTTLGGAAIIAKRSFHAPLSMSTPVAQPVGVPQKRTTSVTKGDREAPAIESPPAIESQRAIEASDLPSAPTPSAISKKANRPFAQVDQQTDLRDEVRALDGARSALEENPARALQLLDDYDRAGSGTLSQESTVVRIEALAKLGRRTEASSLAHRFLTEHPKSPHREAILRFVGDER